MNELDDFICSVQSDELTDYTWDWQNADTWLEVESNFVKEIGIEAECYDD